MHNKEWLEVVDEDEAEEYQDAVALNNAMASLHMNQPLDAAALDDGHDLDDRGAGEYGGTANYGIEAGYGESSFVGVSLSISDGHVAFAHGGWPASLPTWRPT